MIRAVMKMNTQIFGVFTVGAVGYGLIEILWRGHTHWTMLIAGGLCFLIMYYIANYLPLPLPAKYLLSGAAISVVELLTGLLVNLWLRWDVWDYSGMRLNLLGQICPFFCCAWVLLSVPGVALCRLLYRRSL